MVVACMCLDVVFKDVTVKELAFGMILQIKDIMCSKDIPGILDMDLLLNNLGHLKYRIHVE